jgi:hypothetical protein
MGPAHLGTDAGEIDADGLALLKEMERLNIILDATHLVMMHFGSPRKF